MQSKYPNPWIDEPISRFKGEYFFLSNFYASPIVIEYKGQKYTMATGEHCFQGMKVAASIWDTGRTSQWLEQVSQAPTPAKSKYLGRSIQIDVPKWNAMAFACMQRTQQLKYSQNPELREKLIATGERELIEGTEWGDKLWGVDERGEGQNLLGKILMELRASLKSNWLD
jgi:ribA/ribD-fused uncharacterized protein